MNICGQARSIGQQNARKLLIRGLCAFVLLVFNVSKPDQKDQNAKNWVLASGILARKELEQAEGGSLSTREVTELLGLHSLAHKRHARELIAWRGAGGKWRYPRWQFGAGGILPGLKDCLDSLGTDSGFGAMIFFLSPRYSLDGKRPLDLLRDSKIREVVAVAERHDTHAAW